MTSLHPNLATHEALMKTRQGNDPIDYINSSAKFYVSGEQGTYLIKDN